MDILELIFVITFVIIAMFICPENGEGFNFRQLFTLNPLDDDTYNSLDPNERNNDFLVIFFRVSLVLCVLSFLILVFVSEYKSNIPFINNLLQSNI